MKLVVTTGAKNVSDAAEGRMGAISAWRGAALERA
jgi:hypothetical protein